MLPLAGWENAAGQDGLKYSPLTHSGAGAGEGSPWRVEVRVRGLVRPPCPLGWPASKTAPSSPTSPGSWLHRVVPAAVRPVLRGAGEGRPTRWSPTSHIRWYKTLTAAFGVVSLSTPAPPLHLSLLPPSSSLFSGGASHVVEGPHGKEKTFLASGNQACQQTRGCAWGDRSPASSRQVFVGRAEPESRVSCVCVLSLRN